MLNKTAEQYYNEGMELEKLSEYKLALERYEKSIEVDENFAKGHFGVAEISSCLLHDYIKSIKHYMRAIELDKNYIDAWFNLMLQFHNLAKGSFGDHLKFQKEEDLYWEALELTTTFEKHDEAIKKLEEAIKMNQNSVLSYVAIGWIHQKQNKDHTKAIEYYKKAIEKFLFLMPDELASRLDR